MAVLRIGGKQYRAAENQTLTVDRLNNKVGDTLELAALLVKDEGLKLGKEAENQPVLAQVLEHLRGKKIRIAKFKAKSRYRRVRGFRPSFTKIKIVSIGKKAKKEEETEQPKILTPKTPAKKRGRPSKKS